MKPRLRAPPARCRDNKTGTRRFRDMRAKLKVYGRKMNAPFMFHNSRTS